LGYAEFTNELQMPEKPSPAETYRSSGAGTIQNKDSQKCGPLLFLAFRKSNGYSPLPAKELPPACDPLGHVDSA
jgi:hypothetical protein